MKNRILKFLIGIVFVLFTTTNVYAFSFRNMTLDFVHISDTHITERSDTPYKALSSSKDLLKDAVEQINDITGLDFVMFTGDLVDYASYDNYMSYYSILSKLKYPSINAFGNHDFTIGGLGKEEVLEIVQKCNPNYTFDNTYYAITPKTDYRIIVLDAVIKEEQSSNGWLPEEQLEFLDNELEQNQDKVILIALHFPPVEPFAAKEHELTNANEFNEILLKYKNPIVVISGHYHTTKIRRIGNLVFVSTPAMVTYPMAFRHIKITNYKDRVHYDFDFIPTRLEDVRNQNKQTVISWATLEGWAKDRKTSFSFNKKHPKSAQYKRNKIAKATKEASASKRELRAVFLEKFQKDDNKPSFADKCKNLFKRNKKEETLEQQQQYSKPHVIEGSELETPMTEQNALEEPVIENNGTTKTKKKGFLKNIFKKKQKEVQPINNTQPEENTPVFDEIQNSQENSEETTFDGNIEDGAFNTQNEEPQEYTTQEENQAQLEKEASQEENYLVTP